MLYGDGVDTRDPAAQRPPPRAAPAARACATAAGAPSAGATDLQRAAASARPACIKRRSLVFVVSDFISDAGLGTAAGAARAAPRGRSPCACYDPLEMELPDLGLLDDAGRRDRRAALRRHARRAASASASRASADAARGRAARRASSTPASMRWSSSTDDDLVDAILRFADLRKRRSQLAAGGLPRTCGTPPDRSDAMTFLWPELLWLLLAAAAAGRALRAGSCAARRRWRVRYASPVAS